MRLVPIANWRITLYFSPIKDKIHDIFVRPPKDEICDFLTWLIIKFCDIFQMIGKFIYVLFCDRLTIFTFFFKFQYLSGKPVTNWQILIFFYVTDLLISKYFSSVIEGRISLIFPRNSLSNLTISETVHVFLSIPRQIGKFRGFIRDCLT